MLTKDCVLYEMTQLWPQSVSMALTSRRKQAMVLVSPGISKQLVLLTL